MPRAIYRLSDDIPAHWLRPALFHALEERLLSIDVSVVLGRPGTHSAITDLSDELTSAECAALADEVHRIVQDVFNSKPKPQGEAA